MTTEQLKACAHCDGLPLQAADTGLDYDHDTIVCDDCGATAPTAEAWNRRTPAMRDDDLWHIAGVVTSLNGGNLFNVSQRECVMAIRAAFMDPDAGRAFIAAQTAEPYGYVLKSGYGIYFRETLAGVEPDFVKHWVPLYTHPAKTEQPAAPQQAVAWTVTVGEDVKNCIEITHCEEDARAQYAESTKGGYENLYLLRPLYFHSAQRQDSDKEHN